MTIILLAGLLASARLHLKAHTPKDIYVGFFIGTVTPFCLQYLL
jgi:membrane-associated phospholipid phosphatase